MSAGELLGGADPDLRPAAPPGASAPARGLPRLGVALATWSAAAVGVALALWTGAAGWRVLVDGHDLIGAVVGVSATAVGAFVIVRQPRHALAWVFIGIGQSETLAVLASAWAGRQPSLPGAQAAAVLADVAWLPGFVLAAALVAPLFPDGRPLSSRWRPVVVVGAATCAVVSLVLPFLHTGDLPDGVRNPLAPEGGAQTVIRAVTTGGVAVAVACGLAGAAGLVVRAVRSRGHERRRLLWFPLAFVVVVVCQALPVNAVVPTVAAGLVPIALGVAMLREGLFDGDRLLNRTLVTVVLTALVAALFGLVAGFASSRIGGTTTGAVAAAVVVALGLAPARQAVQRVVDRVLIGERADPYAALERLGARLGATIATDEVLPAVVRTVATSLLAPWAAVTLAGERTPTAEEGTPTAAAIEVPLRHAGTDVGVLAVGLRPGRRFLDPADQRLLEGFAQQAAVAADSVRLAAQLRRSRDQLALAREEERHRIRRDLHDGLGPTLAGVALGLGAARRSSRGEVAELLAHLQQELSGSLEDVRRLVADLRPTPLEQLGLLEALFRYGELVTARSGGALEVHVAAGGPVGPLAEEVEVALYRIVLEAVTNVARHAGARHCWVRLDPGDPLVLTVADDGVGLPAQRRAGGLGLRSMAERAAEVGGGFCVGAAEGGGTVVRVTVPAGGARA